ncbi:hypothetical protein NLU13_8100 [Sarocladium strictum]|uniref:AA1-like domain-containing protein n=1 Tax=Sarocladium strictum TaxID=5046 RepID=A0AA39GBH8_SARSR|nr:hypothetical protein NLU13_8100 [Sarocladium strictum]
MHAASALLAIFTASAAAFPATRNVPSENIDIADFTVRKTQAAGSEDKTIESVSFKLSGDDAKDLLCSASEPGLPSKVLTCGESKYRFVLQDGTDGYEFGLTIYHELGPAVGFWGEGVVPTYCHAGGNGVNDFVCSETGPTTIVITNGATE